MVNNYDKIARFYDRLSRLIFFKSQVNAQIDQLCYLPEKGRVLIVGGGTGWILEEIAKIHPEGLSLVYVEISAKMIGLSKERKLGRNAVSFVNLGIEDFYSEVPFDVICTPFLFDNFAEKRAAMVFHHLDTMLNDKGLWFHTDFNLGETREETEKEEGGTKWDIVNKKTITGGAVKTGSWWKGLFLALMYRFFKVMGNIEASKLIHMNPYFTAAGYKLIEEKYYYAQFIQSSIFQKRG